MNNHPWSLISKLIRLMVYVVAIFLACVLPFCTQMLATLLNIEVPDNSMLELRPEETVMRDLANSLLQPSVDEYFVSAVFISVLLGWIITRIWGVKPAFPWQAEHFRDMCWLGAICTLFIGLCIGGYSLFSVYGEEALTVPQLLLSFGLWDVFAFLIVLLLMAGVALILAFATGLQLPTHFGVRWMAPGPMGGVGQVGFNIVVRIVGQSLGLDQVAGAIGVVLDELRQKG